MKYSDLYDGLDLGRKQERPNASSTLFSVPRPLRLINIPLRLKHILRPILSNQARHIGQILPSLLSPPFREGDSLKWGPETRGLVEPKDFVVVILAHYSEWIMTVSGLDQTLQLNAVWNDIRILLKTLGYVHGDTRRRWYFVMDFDVDYEDTNGVTRPVPRKPVLPSWDGILGILREASAGGGSGFVHFGGHCMYTTAGTSNITQLEPYRYSETPNGSPVMEAFIVTTDGRRLYGRDFIESLGDGADKRYGTTLTISLDMCNASAFLAGVVEMPYQYRGESIQEPTIPTTRSTNQLIVISASQPRQVAGTFSNCGAMTFFLVQALMNGGSAADVIKHVHDMCQGQPKKHLLQTPQITSRYQLTGTFGLLPTQHSML